MGKTRIRPVVTFTASPENVVRLQKLLARNPNYTKSDLINLAIEKLTEKKGPRQ